MDMEWRAGFGTVCTQRLALIQLAVKGQVFMLDLCAPGLRHHSLPVNFIRSLLADQSILKLGECSHPGSNNILKDWAGFHGKVDVLTV